MVGAVDSCGTISGDGVGGGWPDGMERADGMTVGASRLCRMMLLMILNRVVKEKKL